MLDVVKLVTVLLWQEGKPVRLGKWRTLDVAVGADDVSDPIMEG
jgi:hypothetical protein